MTLLFQEQGGNGGIHAARHADHYLTHPVLLPSSIPASGENGRWVAVVEEPRIYHEFRPLSFPAMRADQCSIEDQRGAS